MKVEEKSICEECAWDCKQNRKIKKTEDVLEFCSNFRKGNCDEDSL